MHRLFDGRVYIGITCQTVNRRWQNGGGYSKSPKFYNAIRKYGWDAFDHIVLETNLSKAEAERKEKEQIALYRSTERDRGFNADLGGFAGVHLSNETKAKIRETQLGKRASDETKAKMSATRKGKKQSPEHIAKRAATRVGTHLSEATKEKISKSNAIAQRGRKHSKETKRKMSENSGRKRPIEQIDGAGNVVRVFSSLSEAACACNTTAQNIWLAANNARGHAGGYAWRYAAGGASNN